MPACGPEDPIPGQGAGVNTGCALGLDLGSTTVKLLLLSPENRVLEARYARHGTAVRRTLAGLLRETAARCPGLYVQAALCGSSALELAREPDLPFVQEVMAAATALRACAPDTDTAVELGGEDAKILYLSRGMDLRMNEVCAGGTGAFLDQTAALLHTDAAGLDRLAAGRRTVYPIASRCGVFAKTDIASLINEGVCREDIAASILQAVVDQTLGGLACGNPVRGRVAFLGGPLHFLPELRRRFVATLHLRPDEVVQVDLPHFIAARGAALSARQARPLRLEDLAARLETPAPHRATAIATLPPLFESDADIAAFRVRHAGRDLPSVALEAACGPLFLGLDFGSTTVKVVLIDAQGRIAASFYGPNGGDPLAGLLPELIALLRGLPPGTWIAGSCATGYGAETARIALGADLTEVETLAHLRAACRLVPDADRLLDIGGQDMKFLKIEQGLATDITLNEACSAGCGAFLETFARSLNMDMDAFVRAALRARRPVDLGTRCTVFMTSRVRQAQKDGASVEAIAAGLCWAVARNALYKVLRSPDQSGRRMVVQGGALLNDALLRALERLLDREVIRPVRSGLAGAYGAALTALRRQGCEGRSGLRSADELAGLKTETAVRRCAGCGNRCRLTVHTFSGNRRLISGNRCERGAGIRPDPAVVERNLFAWKLDRLFGPYRPLAPDRAPRGRLGLPRALGMYELYPFWFTLFTHLGFRVELSGPSNKAGYLRGLESVPSQSLCFPAKLAHAHVEDLLARGVADIFFPCVPRTEKEDPDAADSFTCPVVCSYPAAVRLNCDLSAVRGARLHTPFVRPDRPEALVRTLGTVFGVSRSEARRAAAEAARAQARYRDDLRRQGEAVLERARRQGLACVILAGRPYHADPLVHHGLPDLLASLGAAVVCEDAVAHLAPPADHPLRVRDQWTWHGRLYRAARLAASRPDLELVQLTSFGCGPDAVTADQVQEILHRAGKSHTSIKIDEGESQGPARIRLRSLLAAMQERREARGKTAGAGPVFPVRKSGAGAPEPLTGVCRPSRLRDRIILAPQMAPLHFRLVEAALRGAGYDVHVLPRVCREDVEQGLTCVNNDACYPAVLVIGQLLRALKQGPYRPETTALLLARTCGPCRATNYGALLRRALNREGLSAIPVLSINRGGSDLPCLAPSAGLLNRMITACLYADMLRRLSLACRTYERRTGAADELLELWLDRAARAVSRNAGGFERDIRHMTRDFAAVPCDRTPRPAVGVAGEILLRFHPDANNNLFARLRTLGGEPAAPDLADFLLYCLADPLFEHRHLGGRAFPALAAWCTSLHIERRRDVMRRALAEHARRLPGAAARPPARITDLAARAEQLISTGHRAGEGWLLAADMLEFTAHGIPNVICVQPFGCLPNHVTGKGLFKALRQLHPQANLTALDYDPAGSDTNRDNRLRLFMAVARERLESVGPSCPPERPETRVAERFMPGAFPLPDNLAHRGLEPTPIETIRFKSFSFPHE